MTGRLLLVGCGKMGGALLKGWLDGGTAPSEITVVEPAGAGNVPPGPAVHDSADSLDKDLDPAVVVFAVKPQMMDGVLPDYARFVRPATVFLSIAAGTTVAVFERHLGGSAAIVRSMPNTPAAVGRGITAAVANAHVTEEQRAACDGLLSAVGAVVWLADEAQLDPVTAVSGSGPAYVFLLTECLAAAGVDAGLPEDLAMELARATVSGAGDLMRLSAEPPAQLRQNVTSPGGTTEAALEVLMDINGLQKLMTAAVAAAAARSKELAG